MKKLLANLPSVDELLKDEKIRSAAGNYPHKVLAAAAREILKQARDAVLEGKKIDAADLSRKNFVLRLSRYLETLRADGLRPVINCTGVVIHTNLGRAPISAEVLRHAESVSASYSNLEYDVELARRGSRDIHTARMLRILTQAEDSVVVNNNAAALLLTLAALAKHREVIVSRGEIVEIGGGFRVNEIMSASGARLKEVGTTNKTRLSDYLEAIGPKTAAILKVHSSNFKIVGFEESVGLDRIVKLGKEKGVLTIFDAGSGLLVDPGRADFGDEPVVCESVKSGADIVTFSGDKLLGGPQCGIAVGKKELIDKLKKNPLGRALRISKITLACLESTLKSYLNGDWTETVPVWRMLSAPKERIKQIAEDFMKSVRKSDRTGVLSLKGKDGKSLPGGGSCPLSDIETYLVAVKSRFGAQKMERFLREWTVPIITRIEDGEVLLDLRTVLKHEIDSILKAFDALIEALEKGNL